MDDVLLCQADENGEPNGLGRAVWGSTMMEGFIKTVKLEQGSTIALDGYGRKFWNRYWEEGNFRENKLEGWGRRVWSNGYTQEGQFSNGKFVV